MPADCGTVNVVAPTTKRDVSISNCGVSPQQINPGDEVSITADVSNNGATDADVTVALTADGSQADSLTETIQSGQQITAEFVQAPQSDVSYSVNVGSVSSNA